MRKSTGSRHMARKHVSAALAFAVMGVSTMVPLSAPTALAATERVKADNSQPLNNDLGWTTVQPNPNGSEVGLFNNTLVATTPYSFVMGGDLNWAGIHITNPSTQITFTGGTLLTLGANGIDMSAATRSLTLGANVKLRDDVQSVQTWSVATGLSLVLGSGASGGNLDTGSNGNMLALSLAGNASVNFSNTAAILSGNGTILQNGGVVSFASTAANLLAFTGSITLQSGTLSLGIDRNVANIATTVVLNGGGGTWTDPDSGFKNFQVAINGSANTYTNPGNGSWSTSSSQWYGSGTLTYAQDVTGHRLTFTNTNLEGGTSNVFSNFSGLIILSAAFNDNKSGLFLNRTGTNSGYLGGNSLMGIDVGPSRLSTQNGGTFTLGYVKSNSTNGVISGANGGTTISTRYIVGNSLVNSTFAGTLQDGANAGTNASATLDFVKVGTSTLTLSNTAAGSSVSGVFGVLDGTVEIGHASELGTGNSTFNGVGAANMILGGGTYGTNATLRYIGTASTGTNRIFTTNSNITIQGSGTGAFNWNGAGAIVPMQGSDLSSNPLNTTITFGGASAASVFNTFTPQIGNQTTNGAGVTSIIKTDANTWVLASTGNTYTGPTIATGGLYINASQGGLTGTSGLVVAGTFGGRGIINGTASIDGRLVVGMPGVANGVGTLNFQSGLVLKPNTGIDLEFTLGGANDQVNLANASNVGQTLDLSNGNFNVTALQAGNSVPLTTLGSYAIFTNIGSLNNVTPAPNNTLTNMTVTTNDPTTKYRLLYDANTTAIYLEASNKGSRWMGSNGTDPTDWTANSGSWNGTVPGTATGDIAYFGLDGGSHLVNLNANQTVGIVVLDNGSNTGYTLAPGAGGNGAGNTLILDNTGNDTIAQIFNRSGNNAINTLVKMNQDTIINLSSGNTLTFGNTLSGNANVTINGTVNGSGIAVFAANNTYVGITSVLTGLTLTVGNGSNSGTFGNGNISNLGVINLNRSDSFLLNNGLSGTGTWNLIGSGTTTLAPTPSNFTFSTFNVTSGVVFAGSVNLGGATTISNATLNADLSRISGALTVSNGTLNASGSTISGASTITNAIVNAQSSTISNTMTITNSTINAQAALISGGITMNSGYVNTGTMSRLNGAIIVRTGRIDFNGTNNGAALTIAGTGPGTVEMNGNSLSFTSLTGSTNTGTIINSGALAALTLKMPAATNTSYSGVLTGAMSLVLSNPAVTANGGSLSLTAANNYTGKTIIGNAGETANGGGAILVLANGAIPTTSEIDIFGRPNGVAPVQLGNVTMPNNIVFNSTAGASEFLTGVAGASGTFTGTFTNLSNYTSGPNDITNSNIRIGGGAATGSLTLSNVLINSSDSAGTSVIVLRQGVVTLNNSTINSLSSQFVLGRSVSGTVTLAGSSVIKSSLGTGLEGGNIGGSQQGNNLLYAVNMLGTSQIDVGQANFNLNNGASGSTVNFQTTVNTIIKTGGFTRGGAANTVTNWNADGGTIVATQDNSSFLPATGMNFQILNNDVNFNIGAFRVGVSAPLQGQGFGGLTIQGTGSLTLSGNNTYTGNTTIPVGATLLVGAGGTSGSLGQSDAQSFGFAVDNGTLGFNRTDASFVVFNPISGSGALANLGSGTTTLFGAVNIGGSANIAAGLVIFGGSGTAHSTGAIAGAGKVEVDVSNHLSSLGVITNGWIIKGNQTIVANGNTTGVSEVSSLAIAGGNNSWTAGLDLTNNPLILLNADSVSKAANLSILQNQISFGANNTGLGITSSTATSAGYTVLALVDNNDAHLTSFRGVTGMDNNSLIVVRAHDGDTNLDGKVNSLDLTTLANNWQKSGGALWSQGDFNGDGAVNSLDLTTVANNWQFNGTPLQVALAQFPQFGGSSSVPEPASLAVLAFGSAALLARRKRRVSKSDRL